MKVWSICQLRKTDILLAMGIEQVCTLWKFDKFENDKRVWSRLCTYVIVIGYEQFSTISKFQKNL